MCIIFKCPSPLTLKRCNLIGLCNTTYKLVRKILVEIITHILPSVIGLNQASFFHNKEDSDNAIIVKEYISTLGKIEGQNSNVMLKITSKKPLTNWNGPT